DPALRDEFRQTLGASPPQTFDVGLPYANLGGPGQMVVLDPLGEPAISLGTIGHRRLRLRVQRVEAGDWDAFSRIDRPGGGGPARLPGRGVVDRVITIEPPIGEPREIRVDVSPALANGLGHAIVAVEALDGGSDGEREQASYTWVQATRIGVSAFSDADDLLAWATSLVDGAPVAGAEVQLVGGGGPVRAATDARGVATLAFATDSADADVLVVKGGADVALLPRSYGNWRRVERMPAALWYAFTDRNLYKPGEQVRFKGWVRRLEQTPTAVPELPQSGGADSVRWTAYDARRNRIAQGAGPLTALGGFDGQFTVPAGANLGGSSIEVELVRAVGMAGHRFSFAYQVQEFRRPEYTVTATVSDGPHFLGESAEVAVRAAYFAGGPLAAAPVRWTVTSMDGSYTPPGWDEWSFGDAPGWWRPTYRPGGNRRTQTLNGATNAAGENVLRISFTSADPPRPYTVAAEATVRDVNRQTWSAAASMLVHPSQVYVGVRSERGWLSVGDSIDLNLIAVDVDGTPVPGRTIEVTTRRTVWRQTQAGWNQTTENLATCTRQSEPQPVRCVFPVSVAGQYEGTATVRDAEGRVNQTVVSYWVTDPRGGYTFGPGNDGDGGRSVELIPDRKTYAVGDTARLLVRTQFQPSVGLLTTRVNGIARVEEVRLRGATTTLTVPITEAGVPNLNLQLDLVGASDGRHGEGARGVLYATGTTTLSVPPATRALAVEPLPRDTVSAPDAQTEVGVEVRDAAGRPVANAEVALVVVDEAVLALTGYRVPDPLAAFYRSREAGVQDLNLRERVRVSAPDYAPEPHTLVGRVVDARNGGWLGGARLVLDGRRDTLRADESGRFRILNVAAGTHALMVSMEGYAAARVSVTVSGDQAPPPLRIALVPTAVDRLMRREGSALGLAGVVMQGIVETREAPAP
ncbi:MAG: carboxypeptidase regulatory-like domain-containing protein, partial [Longimicrobiaceae bacterium]